MHEFAELVHVRRLNESLFLLILEISWVICQVPISAHSVLVHVHIAARTILYSYMFPHEPFCTRAFLFTRQSQAEQVDSIEDHVERAASDVSKGASYLAKVHKSALNMLVWNVTLL